VLIEPGNNAIMGKVIKVGADFVDHHNVPAIPVAGVPARCGAGGAVTNEIATKHEL
jgi:hypothetical protein